MKVTNDIWKGIVLIFLSFLSLVVLVAIGILFWTRTWKTYQFPDNQGSVRYPQTWKVREDINPYPFSLDVSIYSDANNMAVSFVRYYPSWNIITAEDEARLRIREDEEYIGEIPLGQSKISGEKAYSAQVTDETGYSQTIETSHKGYEYEFGLSYSNEGIIGFWNKFVMYLIFHTIYFNPSATANSLHAPEFSN